MNGVSPSLTICFLWSAIIVIVMIVLLTSSTIALSFSNGQRASYVLGQTDFNSGSEYAGGLATSSRSLNNPTDLTFDSYGNLWVTDTYNDRVLRYSPPFTWGKAADVVLGQQDFESSLPSEFYKIFPPILALFYKVAPHITAKTLAQPSYLSFDLYGHLWVSDTGNNRVLEYSPPFTNGKAADVVLGQPNFFSSEGRPSISASLLLDPRGLAFDVDRLWVADSLNNRVLEYSPPFTNGKAADVVLGQRDFISGDYNAGRGISPDANTLHWPQGIKFLYGDIWVADTYNSRVLRFSPSCDVSFVIYDIISICDVPNRFFTGQKAELVIGQRDFSSSGHPGTHPEASSLNGPQGLAFDSKQNLWVTDEGDDRILGYHDTILNYCKPSRDHISTCYNYISELLNIFGDPFPYLRNFLLTGWAADVVLGKPDFTSNMPSYPTASSLYKPSGLKFDSRKMYVPYQFRI